MLQPEPLIVRTSIWKLAVLTFFWSPVALSPPAIVISSILGVLNAYHSRTAHLWPFVILFAFPCYLLYLYWVVATAKEPFLRALPEGLVMPSLGSARPIPWSNVSASDTTFKFLSCSLSLTIDATIYNRQFYSKLLGPKTWYGNPAKVRLWVPWMFDTSGGRIVDAVRAFRNWEREKKALSESRHPSNMITRNGKKVGTFPGVAGNNAE